MHAVLSNLSSYILSSSIAQISTEFSLSAYLPSDSVKDPKVVLDTAFINTFGQIICDHSFPEAKLSEILDKSVIVAKRGLSSTALPIKLCGDLLECQPIERCGSILVFLEKNIDVWKSPMFMSTQKSLQPICNEFLRRLSRVHHLDLCSRIQLFLARLLPLCDRSGVNLMGHFHSFRESQVSTVVNDVNQLQNDGFYDEVGSMEDGEMLDYAKMGIQFINSQFCQNFWTLQRYFSSSSLISDNSEEWNRFRRIADDVLDAFEAVKDSNNLTVDTINYSLNSDVVKYLTSENLMPLQISDVIFRRHILLQFIIFFQYLKLCRKTATAKNVQPHSEWIESSNDRCYRLISQTGKDGEDFAAALNRVMQHERTWNTWKNNRCPDFTVPAEAPKAKRMVTVNGISGISFGSMLQKMEDRKCPFNIRFPLDIFSSVSIERNSIVEARQYCEENIERIKAELMSMDDQKASDTPTLWCLFRLIADQQTFACEKMPRANTNVEILKKFFSMAANHRSCPSDNVYKTVLLPIIKNMKEITVTLNGQSDILSSKTPDLPAEDVDQPVQKQSMEYDAYIRSSTVEKAAVVLSPRAQQLVECLGFVEDLSKYLIDLLRKGEMSKTKVTELVLHKWIEITSGDACIGKIRDILVNNNFVEEAAKLFPTPSK